MSRPSRAGTHQGRIRCSSLRMAPRKLGSFGVWLTIIGAAFVACALVYLVAKPS
jgi:hypothetical protein